MVDQVFCNKYKQQLPALTNPPFPGEKGIEIQKSISAKAWLEWIKLQNHAHQ